MIKIIIYQSTYFICFCGNYSTWLIRSVSSFNLNYSTPKKKYEKILRQVIEWRILINTFPSKLIHFVSRLPQPQYPSTPSPSPTTHPPTHTPDIVNFNIPVTVNVYLVYMLCLPIDRNMTFSPGPSQRLLNIDGIKILYIIDEGIFNLYYTHTPTHSGVKVLRPNC